MADLGRAALKKASKGTPVQGNNSLSGQVRREPKTGLDLEPTTQFSDNATSTSTGVVESQIDTPEVGAMAEQSNLVPEISATPQASVSPVLGFDATVSSDWLNFDTAFENFDAVLGSSGADLSMELLRPFNFEDFGLGGVS
jgi:hypothetical protein